MSSPSAPKRPDSARSGEAGKVVDRVIQGKAIVPEYRIAPAALYENQIGAFTSEGFADSRPNALSHPLSRRNDSIIPDPYRPSMDGGQVTCPHYIART